MENINSKFDFPQDLTLELVISSFAVSFYVFAIIFYEYHLIHLLHEYRSTRIKIVWEKRIQYNGFDPL